MLPRLTVTCFNRQSKMVGLMLMENDPKQHLGVDIST
jgi:hypothetical protein